MLCAVLNKSWKQHPTKQLLYGHLPLISQTIKVKLTRHVGQCWSSKDKLKATFFNELLKMDTLVLANQQELIYINSVETVFSLEDQLEAIYYRDEWSERVRECVREVYAVSVIWWCIYVWWESVCIYIYIYIYIYAHVHICNWGLLKKF